YVSDPAKPVPHSMEISLGWNPAYMTEDQRFAARRPDVLVFETPPLDRDVTFAGPLEADLWVSTTGTDSDWVVKLIDVNPDKPRGWTKEDTKAGKRNQGGRQMLVRGEPFRGRFRESYSEPRAFKPGEPTKVRFTLN